MVVTESWLRAGNGEFRDGAIHLAADDIITQAARDYLRERKIAVVRSRKAARNYRDTSGHRYKVKPEHMTHLRGDLLVPKTNLRIAFRGKLDTLQAQLLLVQCKAHAAGRDALVQELENILAYVREMLACEVKGTTFCMELLGMDERAVHDASHNPAGGHPVPDYTMGEIALGLNLSRALAREVELSAVNAFTVRTGIERTDIIRGLNRLSSGLYILFLRYTNRQEEKGDTHNG